MEIEGDSNQANQYAGGNLNNTPLNNETTIINAGDCRAQGEVILGQINGLRDSVEHAKKAHIYLLCGGIFLLVLNLVAIGLVISTRGDIKESRLEKQHETASVMTKSDSNLIKIQMLIEEARQKNLTELQIILRDTRDLMITKIEAESLLIVNQNADARRSTHEKQMGFMEKMAEKHNANISSIKEALKDNREIMSSHIAQACRE